jgi:hypothetical protein
VIEDVRVIPEHIKATHGKLFPLFQTALGAHGG